MVSCIRWYKKVISTKLIFSEQFSEKTVDAPWYFQNKHIYRDLKLSAVAEEIKSSEPRAERLNDHQKGTAARHNLCQFNKDYKDLNLYSDLVNIT